MKQLSIFLLFFSFKTNAQIIKFTASAGSALGTTNFTKTHIPFSEFQIGYEKLFGKEACINISLGQSSLGFNYYDRFSNSVYDTRTFLTLPIFFERNFSDIKFKIIQLFAGIGIEPSWCYNDKKEYRSFQTDLKKVVSKNIGFNVAGIFEVGSHILINQKTFLNITIQPQVDFATIYSNKLDKIKLIKNLISISYCINLSKEITHEN